MRTRRPIPSTLVAIAVVLVLSGCAPRSGDPESYSNWTIKVDQALGAAASGLGTAALILQGQADGDLTRGYVVVSVRDAVRTLGTEVAAFESVQPPHTRADANRDVVETLGKAVTALNAASTAATGGSASDRRRALRDVRATYTAVQDLRDQLTGAGG